MPVIADPYAGRPYGAVNDTSDRAHTRRSRVRAALHRRELTRRIAEGADPRACDELAVRAAQLTSDRSRKSLARALRRTIAEARQPAMTRSRVVIIQRRAVLDAEPAINAMIDRLRSSAPVRAEGTALAERILTNAANSPLYNPSSPGSLRREIIVATAAMEMDLSRSHEFPVGV